MNRFAATTLNERNKRKEALYRLLFGFMTLLLIVPVVLIVATLIVRGGPALSFDFFFSSPTNGMTEGGMTDQYSTARLLSHASQIASHVR